MTEQNRLTGVPTISKRGVWTLVLSAGFVVSVGTDVSLGQVEAKPVPSKQPPRTAANPGKQELQPAPVIPGQPTPAPVPAKMPPPAPKPVPPSVAPPAGGTKPNQPTNPTPNFVQPGGKPTNPNGTPVNPANVANQGNKGAAGTANPTNPTNPANPAGGPAAEPLTVDVSTDDPDMITLSVFAEPVELKTLVELLGKTLNINITIEGDLSGSVVFNAPVPVKKADLLGLIDALLGQQGYTITRQIPGFYTVQPAANVAVKFDGDIATTRVIPTPNVRPSALQQALAAQLGGAGAVNPQTGQATGGGAGRISYVDELGIIVATDTVRKLDTLESLVKRMLEEYGKTQFIRLELNHIAAPVARERALQLIGQIPQSTGAALQPGQPIQQLQQQPGHSGQGLDNMGDRLTVDPQGNALIFRGLDQEVEQVRNIMKVIDKPSALAPKRYEVGAAAAQIADIARQRGLGEVTTISSRQDENTNFFNNGFNPNQQIQGQNRSQSLAGGPVMVVDEGRGTILYYGTGDQQKQMKQLIDELDLKSEVVVIRTYKLNHSDSEKMAELINGLLRNETPASGNPLLGDNSGNNGFLNNPLRPQTPNTARKSAEGASAEGLREGDLSLSGNAFVIANKALNQIIVKAPAKQQPDFEKLIQKLDQRRPQVYLEAKIVSVTWTDDLRVAFETQLINAGGKGGALNTNFGLGSFAASAAITGAKTVTPLSGISAAVIKSEYVPIIINALQKEVHTRILSSPQLLVDDNEEAKLVSVDQQPTTITTQTTGNPAQTGFGSYVDAGTSLTVKPQISDGGYLRLKYEAKLSSFTGASTGNGVPPPKQENTLNADSVTVPSDMTVVLGGLTLDQKGKTRISIPLLGDIPWVGELFADNNNNDRKTTLYIFLTPKIMRDYNFADLQLLTRGPRHDSLIAADVPTLSPTMIRTIEPNRVVSDTEFDTPILPPPAGEPKPVPTPGTPAPITTPSPGPTPTGGTDQKGGVPLAPARPADGSAPKSPEDK
jgi:type II secretory pathway component GspD/PulD (secretin)